MEKILKIEEVEKSDYKNDEHYIGYVVTTTEQQIELKIEEESQCCEIFGCFLSEDNLDEFIGATLLDVTITDINRNTKKLEEEVPSEEFNEQEGRSTEVMFVDLHTSEGVLQFVAYNNGNYGHTATVRSKQLNEEKFL